MKSVFERLATPGTPGMFLSALNARWGGRFSDGRGWGVVESVEPTGVGAATIRIQPPIGWPQPVAGQFVSIGVEIEGVIETRCFTVSGTGGSGTRGSGTRARSSLPGAICEITVQSSRPGGVSAHLVRALRPGDRLLVGSPEGEFTLRSVPTGPVLFLTAGSGITPAMAMLRSLAEQARTHQATIIHHARSAEAVLFDSELALLNARHDWLDVHVVHTRGPAGETLPDARLSAESVAGLCPDWAERQTFLCGPQNYMDAAIDIWASADAIDHLHVESFRAPIYGAVGAQGLDAAVTFAASGVSTTASGSSILDAAEAAGLSPKSGCRMGICHTCVTRVVSGNAIDLRDGSIRSAGDTVQICVSSPVDELTLDL